MRRLAVAACLTLFFFGCKESKDDVVDVGGVRYLKAGDLQVVLLPGWIESPSSPTTPEFEATARRIDPAMKVAPKLVFTRQATDANSPDDAFAEVKAELEALGEKPNVTIERTQMVTRVLPFGSVADIDLRYRFDSKATPKPTRLVHRSLVSLRSMNETELAIVTLTATYLADDANRVAAEVDTIFESLEMATAPASSARP